MTYAAARAAPPPGSPSLTGLRFIAAALVFAFHSSLTNFPLSPFADEDVAHGYEWLFSKAGWIGVSFFFILSGFVLTWSSRGGDTLTSFWRRRLAEDLSEPRRGVDPGDAAVRRAVHPRRPRGCPTCS